MATATKPWQALKGVWEKLCWLMWRCWPKEKPRTPQKTYNQQEGNNQHNTAYLHCETSLQLTGEEMPVPPARALTAFLAQAATAAQHSPEKPKAWGKAKALRRHLPCTDREAKLARRFWSILCWVVRPVSSKALFNCSLTPVQGPEAQDNKIRRFHRASRQADFTLLVRFLCKTSHSYVELVSVGFSSSEKLFKIVQNSRFRWA